MTNHSSKFNFGDTFLSQWVNEVKGQHGDATHTVSGILFTETGEPPMYLVRYYEGKDLTSRWFSEKQIEKALSTM